MNVPTSPLVPSAEPVGRDLLPMTAEVGPNGHLLIGGVDLVELADDVGTPAFVYDEAHVRARCKEAVAGFGTGTAYATKAFVCKAMAALALEEGLSLDVSTAGELAVALAAGAPGDRLVLHGNNKSRTELEAALRHGVGRIVVDSFDEIERLRDLVRSGAASGGRTRLYVRVTPGVEAHTHEFVRTGQEDSKFGLSIASGAAGEAVQALREIPTLPLVGVHMHIGSQIFELDAYREALGAIGDFACEHGFEELCVGGGLGAAYVHGESAPSVTEWAVAVRAAAADAGISPRVRLSAEPGRSIVATAGLTVYRVGTIKRLPGLRTYVSVDGGMSDNPRPVLYGSGYEAFLAREPAAARPLAARVVGKHCESGDVVVDDARLPGDVEVGDLLITPVTGAYGFSMASNYNRVPRPPVLFLSDGQARTVVRRETIEDVLSLDR